MFLYEYEFLPAETKRVALRSDRLALRRVLDHGVFPRGDSLLERRLHLLLERVNLPASRLLILEPHGSLPLGELARVAFVELKRLEHLRLFSLFLFVQRVFA